jgi:hypothetical protein
MIKKAVLLALADGVLAARELYWLDDQEFFDQAARQDYPPLGLAGRVARRQLFKQVATRPCAPDGPAAERLANLTERLAAEAEIAREASRLLGRPVAPESVIIDVPEPISFEIDLPVLDPGGSRPFAEADGVFSAETVRGFARSLRRAALIAEADPELQAVLDKMGGGRLLEAPP